MQKRTFFTFIAVALLMGLMIGCEREAVEPENGDQVNEEANCNNEEVSYADVRNILQSNGCIGCHGGGSINLSNYEGVKRSADDGTLLGSIRHDAGYKPMPQGGGKIDACEIDAVEVWINNGANNN